MIRHLPTPVKAGLERWQTFVEEKNVPHLFNNQTYKDIENVILKRYEIPHGDMPRWEMALKQLPAYTKNFNVEFSDIIRVYVEKEQTNDDTIEKSLKEFRPWRKGPFNLLNQSIDSEWRSDFKWHRINQNQINFEKKTVLDIGSGNGYYGWQMLKNNAKAVISIDSSLLLQYQFSCVSQYYPSAAHVLLPIRFSELPGSLMNFDTIVCMGVLSHTKEPIDFLKSIKKRLTTTGTLILETLIINSTEKMVISPTARYAKMKNVYSLPSPSMLIDWIEQAGFSKTVILDINQTNPSEQRKTDWIISQSLEDFLDPNNNNLTVEGHPAPTRLLLTAQL